MTVQEKAKIDPSSVYSSPKQIVNDNSLTRKEKIDLLRRWAYDEREKAVAEEENMINYDNHERGNILDEILKALIDLGIDKDQNAPPPTKQG